MLDSGGFSSRKISNMQGPIDDAANSSIWTSKRIDEIMRKVREEAFEVKGMRNSPFKDNNPDLKRGSLPFEYTPEEIEELKKCKADVLYFAYNYCKIKTHDKGVVFVHETKGLRDFQEEILLLLDGNARNILMASRQVGKTVTSAIFILWFLLFQRDKTALAVADTFTTTRELIQVFSIALEGLPFFMKPGINTINQGNAAFDNGSRLVGRTTTKKSGIGLAVNLLYIDEFAHIDQTKLDEFYRAIYPTVSADPYSKIIITSTPSGRNKFYDMWIDAVNGASPFVPMRVDYWQVPGRDDKWKEETIAELGGSVEAFNQEYGLQFFSSDQLLLNANELTRLYNIKIDYKKTSFQLPEDWAHINEYLSFHPRYAQKTLDDIKNDPSKFVFSIDTADGDGGDYSTLTIFKAVCLPLNELLKKKEAIRSELDCVSLVEIGKFRSNELDMNRFAAACEYITYKIFNAENTRIILEMNHKGEIVHTVMAQNYDYWTSQFIHTKHTSVATNPKVGIRLGPTNKKEYCEKFKYYIMTNKIIPNSTQTVMELAAFGKSKNGGYRSQNGNDDLAMTAVNLAPVFSSSQYWDIAIETYENAPREYHREVEEKIFNVYLDGRDKSMYNFDELKDLNGVGAKANGRNNNAPHVFDPDAFSQMQKMQQKFFKD